MLYEPYKDKHQIIKRKVVNQKQFIPGHIQTQNSARKDKWIEKNVP